MSLITDEEDDIGTFVPDNPIEAMKHLRRKN